MELINKELVIRTIKDYFKMIIDKTDDDVDCVLDYNKNLCNNIEKMQQSDAWIPCSERLPNTYYGSIYVTLEHNVFGTRHVRQMKWYMNHFENLNGSILSDKYKIIAWMPKRYPQPYKEVSNEL